MKLTTLQNAALSAGFGLMAAGLLIGVANVNATRFEGVTQEGTLRVVPFDRMGPCGTCGTAAPVRIDVSDGTVWHITEAGTIAQLGKKYCYPLACRITVEKVP